MAEYRELQAAIDAIRDMERHDFEEDHFPDAEYAYNDGLIAAMNAVADIPAADVAEVRHGRWAAESYYAGPLKMWGWKCTACEAFSPANEVKFYKFCPNCGARMDENEGEG